MHKCKGKPPIQRTAELFCLTLEQLVARFPRYHKYTLGSELRKNAIKLMQCIQRALHRRNKRRALQALLEYLEDLQWQLLLAKRLGCIANKTEFSLLAEQLASLTKQGGGWYKAYLNRSSQGQGSVAHWMWLAEAIISGFNPRCVRRLGLPATYEKVPQHKRLAAMPSNCGLPIGNLTSQFFANVYLNELDQFVKHKLKARFYLRYVDDFILLSHSPSQLESWQLQVELFLQQNLSLTLKPARVARVEQGIDFLGYISWANHLAVRKRVISSCKLRLSQFSARAIRYKTNGMIIYGKHLAGLQAQLNSYAGHFSRACWRNLWQVLSKQFTWLASIIQVSATGKIIWPLLASHKAHSMRAQYWPVQQLLPNTLVLMQQGTEWAIAEPSLALLPINCWLKPAGFWRQLSQSQLPMLQQQCQNTGQAYVLMKEKAIQGKYVKARYGAKIYLPQKDETNEIVVDQSAAMA